MRILGFLDRKKQIAPSSQSSVHPASKCQDVYSVKRAKIKELLGVVSPEECHEVDELLNKTPWQIDPSSFTEDDDDDNYDDDDDDAEEEHDKSVKEGLTEGDDKKWNHIIAMPQQTMRSKSDLQLSAVHVDLAAQKLALPPHKSSSAKHYEERASRRPYSVDMTVKQGSVKVLPSRQSKEDWALKVLPCLPSKEDWATQKPCVVDTTAKSGSERKGRPPKLTGICDRAVPWSSRNSPGTTSEGTTAPHPSRIRGKKSATCGLSFPLPPPFCEKHYLPTPQECASEENFSVAHPLPQPPATRRTSNGCVLEHSDDYRQIARAVSHVPLAKPQLSVKEYDSIVRTVSCDPLKQLTQKQRTSQSVVGGFPMPAQKLQNTPPSTPPPQASRAPRNIPLTSPGMQLHQTPQSTLPTTACAQLQQTTHNTPPITPRSQVYPQVFINVPRNVPSPPSSNRQSPRLSNPLFSQSPPHFPSQPTQLAYSPPCSPLPRSLCPRKWSKGQLLGQGTFGTVYEGLNLEDGSYFAVKVSSREDTSHEIKQEVDVLSKLEHPNIVRYYGSSVEDNRFCIFLELMRMGSLDTLLRQYKHFEDQTIRSYTRQILLGLEYLHKKKTMHRDIKCGNILVDVSGQVKLADFGIAKEVDESLASSLKGTPLYMAPEVLIPSKNTKTCYSFPADIWSLGCTVFELAEGKPPWSDLKGFGFFFKLKGKEMPPMPVRLSPEGRDFIHQCLQFHPTDRPTAWELLQHPFVSNVATPEPFFPFSPPSPLSPKLWPMSSQPSSSTWACGNFYPLSPGHGTGFNQVLGGSQRAQTLIHGR